MLQRVSLAQFQTALIVMRATERCIEIIGEAARRVQRRLFDTLHLHAGGLASLAQRVQSRECG